VPAAFVSTVSTAPFTVACPVWMRALAGAGVAVGCEVEVGDGVGLGVGSDVGTLVGVAVGVEVVVVPVVPPHPATITAIRIMMATAKWYLRNLICLFLFTNESRYAGSFTQVLLRGRLQTSRPIGKSSSDERS
jgi:hypothetical protein